MGRKIGEGWLREMGDRGWRELGGVFYEDSNIAQPMYPQRGGYVAPEQSEPSKDSVLDERLKQAEASRDDPGRDDRGMDRE